MTMAAAEMEMEMETERSERRGDGGKLKAPVDSEFMDRRNN